MQEYFTLQKTILKRLLRSWQVAPWLAYVVVPVLFFGACLLMLERTNYAAYAISFFSLSAYGWFAGRQRNDFLRLTFLKPTYRKIRLLENGLVTLPFVLLFLFKGFWALTLVQLLVGGAMAYRTANVATSFALPTPFSWYPFEFAIGFRQYWWLLLIAVFLLVMGVRADNFELSAFSWFVTVFAAMSFYQRPEPGFYVWVHAMTGREFLHRKLLIGGMHLLLLGLPFVITLFLVFPQRWPLVFAGQILALLYLSLTIVVKYTAYPDEVDLPKGFVVACGIIMPPVLLFLLPHYYRQAVRRLGLVLA